MTMMNDARPTGRPATRLLRQPLFRLLAINLAIGIAVAALMLGGLLALNPGRLRDLILADRDGYAALGLLLFGFVVTFGSALMGTAIMAIGRDENRDAGPKGGRRLRAMLAPARAAQPGKAARG
jgi:hypothetical protein